MRKISVLIITILIFQSINAQNYKFGKVSKEELEEKYYPLDSSASAAILYKNRKTYFQYVQGEGFNVVTDVHERIKIYNSDGYDWATKSIERYHTPQAEEKVGSLKAVTFNLVNGKIEETKLKGSNVFNEETSKYWSHKKFTMPSIKDGSVVEWKYKIRSPFRRINDLEFQYQIPVKKIETQIEIPEYFIYKQNQKGYISIPLKQSRKSDKITFKNKSRSSGNVASTTYSQSTVDYTSNIDIYNIDNVPALIEEAYVSNINNFKTAIEYELSELHWPNEPITYYSHNWEDVAKTIYNDSDFGSQIYKSSHFSDDLEGVLAVAKTDSEKIVSIYELVKQKIKWNNYYGLSKFNGTRKAYKEGLGNVSDINLNLVSMLNKAGLTANPVILSTRSHGVSFFPTINGFNYVIAAVEMNGGYVLLDATEEYATPNNLPLRALNWKGRVIRKDKTSDWVSLTPANKAETKIMFNVTVDNEATISGIKRTQYTNLNAQNYRIKYNSLDEDDLLSKLEEKNGGIEILNLRLNNKKDYYKPIVEMFQFEAQDRVEVIGDKMYITPLLFLAENENPFKLEERQYPVDYGSPWTDKISATIKLPDGYKVETLPESFAIKLPDNIGVFKYIIKAVNETDISVMSSIDFNQSIINSNNYQYLKDFYKKIIDKHNEKIVLTKK